MSQDLSLCYANNQELQSICRSNLLVFAKLNLFALILLFVA